MSTNISVSVALEGLRRLSQAQINANRQAKLLDDQRRRLAQQSVDAQVQSKSAQGRDLRGQLLYGIKSDRQRPQPEPVAVYRSGSAFDDYLATAYALRELSWDGSPTSTISQSVKVKSMEGGSPVELTFSSYPNNGLVTSISGYDWIHRVTGNNIHYDVFPVGRETGLLVVASKSARAFSRAVFFPGGPTPPAPGFTEDSYEELPLAVSAIVFNRTGARLLTAPAALVTAYDAHMGNAVYVPGLQNGSYTITRQPSLLYDGYASTALGFAGYGLEAGPTPSIPTTGVSVTVGTPCLQAFLTELPAPGTITSYALLNTFLTGAGVTPPAKSYSNCQLTGTCPTGVFNYDVIGRVANDSDAYLGDETFIAANLRAYAVPTLIAENPGATETNRLVLSAWDWGQPTYCRTKLLELGFTTADLTP